MEPSGPAALTDDDLRAVHEALGVQAGVRALEVTASTNTTALEMARAGAPPWTLVTARHQTAGRGRHGRWWVDEPGGSVLCSVVLPLGEASTMGRWTIAAGVAMAEAIDDETGIGVRCAWPNDLMAGDAKVGGILCEGLVEGGRTIAAVAGVGVNLVAPAVEGSAGVGPADPRSLLLGFCRRLRSSGEDWSGVRERWSERSHTVGRRVRATGTDGSAVDGVALALDDEGGLIITTEAGPVTVTSGLVERLR
jgi:BirA family biotin operon repressor/biotin-[acetyl-CoA-carboxylase] ligase